jgi:hypothetical protein
MPNQCAVCSEHDELLRDCKYCTGVYCPDHALPENHGCPGLAEFEAEDEWVRDRETNVPTVRDDDVRPRPEPLDSDDVTTYGSAESSFESSPDVAVDGSIARDDPSETTPTESDEGIVARFLSTLKFWS